MDFDRKGNIKARRILLGYTAKIYIKEGIINQNGKTILYN